MQTHSLGLRLTTVKGKELYHAARNNKSQFLSFGLPTFWPSDPMKVPDLIDFFVIKGIEDQNLQVEGSSNLS